MAARASRPRQILLGHRRIWIDMRLDRMDAVAVRAHRRHAIAPADSLPVNALHECLRNRRMALAARLRNIEFVD